MEIRNRISNFCYFLAQEYVLTAAHCCDGAFFIEVVLGAHQIRENEDTQVRKLSKEFATHEDWDPNRITNDICWVHIPTVELSKAEFIYHLTRP